MYLNRGRIPETEILFDPAIDPARMAAHVTRLIQPDSRFVIEEGHFGGLVDFGVGLYWAARLPRASRAIESQVADIALSTFAAIDAITAHTMMDYTPLPGYKFANWVFRHAELAPYVREHAAIFLRNHMRRACEALDGVLAQAVYQDDRRPYDSETIVESLFGIFAQLRGQVVYTGMLLHAAKALPQIDEQQYTTLLTHFNRGVHYIIEACEMPLVAGEEDNTIFVNTQYIICLLRRCRHLSPRNRTGIERLIERIAIGLLDVATNPRLSTLIEGVNQDTYHFYASYADFGFWDRYIPGLNAELRRIHDTWQAYVIQDRQ